jgi:hypothetical protein
MGKHVVDDYGEKITSLYDGDRIVRKKSAESYSNMQEWKIEHFYKGHTDEIQQVMDDLNVYEKAFLFSVATYIGYSDCCIKKKNNMPMEFSELIRVSGISRGKLNEVLNSLKNKDIIYRGANSKGIQYFVNPWLFCKGTRINTVLKVMFQNYRVRVLDNRRWKDIIE